LGLNARDTYARTFRPFRSHRQPATGPRACPAIADFMPLSSTSPRLSYSLSGPAGAPPLVFINGLGGVQAAFQLQVRAFRDARQVLVYDHRGAGGSEVVDAQVSMADYAADLVGLLDELSLDCCDIVGLSFGGRVAQELALGWPERVRRLVLCGTSAGGRLHAPGDAQAHVLLRAVASADPEVWASTIAPVLFGRAYRERHPERVSALARWRARHRPNPVGIAAQWGAWDGFDLSDEISEITQRTLILHGTQDGLSPVENAEQLQAYIPDAQLQLLEGVGHSPNVEAPDRFNELISDFLS
jgi:3-oxoadipate enol-lactonase